MYFLDLYHENAPRSGTGAFKVCRDDQGIAKWTFLPATPAGLERLRHIALVCSGRPHVPKMLRELGDETMVASPEPLRLEGSVVIHSPRDGGPGKTGNLIRGCALDISRDGDVRYRPARRFNRLPQSIPAFQAHGVRVHSHFFLGYGASPRAEAKTILDFSDPWHLLSRSASLFAPRTAHLPGPLAGLSNPVMVLEWIRHKGIRLSRYPKRKTLECLVEKLATHLGLHIRAWCALDHCLASAWEGLADEHKSVLLPVLDMVRHMLDAAPHAGHPLREPALILLDRPNAYCLGQDLKAWIDLLHALFPQAQFVVTLPKAARQDLSPEVLAAHLNWPALPQPRRQTLSAPLVNPPKDSVALVHVDGRLPNFALMKISGYFKSQGRAVQLFKGSFPGKSHAEVWGSCIFHLDNSSAKLHRLRKSLGDRLRLGGSGVDVVQRLPPEMEAAQPDYNLYPDLGDRAIGFLTRGCTNNCAFCIVPRKEGTVRQVAEMDELLHGRDKLILLDDNILAHHSGPNLLEEMVGKDVAVNFNQTLDLRLLDAPLARLLRQVRAMNVTFTRPCLHFSLNNAENLETIRRKYDLLGFTTRDNVEFICMYGFNTTLEEDVARFRFLRTLPGAYVFTQRYRPFPGAPKPEELDYFGPNPDPLLDELVRIIFPQNMKSMEIFYRWISRLYAQRYGRLHANLVDTIFRYNNRDRKGHYLATLAGTRPMPE